MTFFSKKDFLGVGRTARSRIDDRETPEPARKNLLPYRTLALKVATATLFLVSNASAQTVAVPGAPAADAAPLRLKLRIVSGARPSTGGKPKFTLEWKTRQSAPMDVEGTNWSQPVDLAPNANDLAALKPDGAPLVIRLKLAGVFPSEWATNADTSIVRTQMTVTGPGLKAPTLNAALFGPTLGIIVWRDPTGDLRAGTMADYNKRYWRETSGAPVPAVQNLIVSDRFIAGDDDALDWRDGLRALRRAGINTILVPPERPLRAILKEAGVDRTGWASATPPGLQRYVDFNDEAPLLAWAQGQAANYINAGFDRHDVGIFELTDEPGWYYPLYFDHDLTSDASLRSFRRYMQDQDLTPTDLGARSWADVRPIGRSSIRDLASRRLFYWSARYISTVSAKYFGRLTAAMEAAFYPGLPTFVNWNNFNGRLYVPGPVAGNPNKTSPDSAMGLQDWFEFGRARGATYLWTEDWFEDSSARQWSFYAAKLRGAAATQAVTGSPEAFGGFVVPRTERADATPDGLTQKVMALVGSGGKAVQYFWFGPEYNFPGNCYSEIPGALDKVQNANAMIAAAQDLLWPGQPSPSSVAILTPRSSEMWDEPDQAQPTGIEDATNTNVNRSTSDYVAEVADLYRGLQDADIPVEFISEDELNERGLKPYRVLYVTEPDVPIEGQRAITAWTRAGGVLATVKGAASGDRYGEPGSQIGLGGERRVTSTVVASTASLGLTPAKGSSVAFQAALADTGAALPRDPTIKVLAHFADGSPAVETQPLGAGEVIHFFWMPGVSYARLALGSPAASEADLAAVDAWIRYPIDRAHVQPRATASASGVETPMLLSAKGAAVTLLNWRGAPLQSVTLTFRLPFQAFSVESVSLGPLPFVRTPTGISVSLPLKAVDVLMIRPADGVAAEPG